ncbi:MAG: hypothetical protein J6A03_00700 [Lachnospiraceae bacterium]|nr:hypothetical protein [Lachnospiraceae bacterium]
MSDLIEVLEKVSELLYQENFAVAYDILAKSLPFLSSCLEDMKDQQMQRELLDALTEAVGAMEEQDATLLADILQYEIVERLKSIGEE